MKNVDINLGKACNNRCLFCSNGNATARERLWGKLEQIEAEIVQRRAEGAQSIGFLGGEPSLYPHLERIARLAREQAYRRISICTNGSRLADPERLDRILDAGVTRVALSIHSHQARIEDGITQRKGSFDEKIRALENLVAEQKRGRLPDGLSLNTVLHRKNVEHLEGFVQFMRQIGIGDIRFNFIRPTYKAQRSKVWVPSFKLATPLVMRLVARNETEFGLYLNFADFPLCKLPWEILANQALRERYVGENWDMVTDVTEMTRQRPDVAPRGTIRFNWKEKRMEFKTFLAGCEHCVLEQRCEGVWQGYLDIYGSREFNTGPSVAEACMTDPRHESGGY